MANIGLGVCLAGRFAVPNADIRTLLVARQVRVCSTPADATIHYFLIADDKDPEAARNSETGRLYATQHPDIKFMRISAFLTKAFPADVATKLLTLCGCTIPEPKTVPPSLPVQRSAMPTKSKSTTATTPPAVVAIPVTTKAKIQDASEVTQVKVPPSSKSRVPDVAAAASTVKTPPRVAATAVPTKATSPAAPNQVAGIIRPKSAPPASSSRSISWDSQDHVQEFDKDAVIDPVLGAGGDDSGSSDTEVEQTGDEIVEDVEALADSLPPPPMHLDLTFHNNKTQVAWLRLRATLPPERFHIAQSQTGEAETRTASSSSQPPWPRQSAVLSDFTETNEDVRVNLSALLALMDVKFPHDDQPLYIPVKLGLFATSLSNKNVRQNHALLFLRQHYASYLQVMLHAGVYKLQQAMSSAFEATQRAYYAQHDAEGDGTERQSLGAVAILLLDRNVTGCAVVLNVGNSAVLVSQREVSNNKSTTSSDFRMFVIPQVPTLHSGRGSKVITPDVTLQPMCKNTTSTAAVVRDACFESSFGAEAVNRRDTIERVHRVHSARAFGSRAWVHDVLRPSNESILEQATSIVGLLDEDAVADAAETVQLHTLPLATALVHSVRVIRSGTHGLSIVVCNDSFASACVRSVEGKLQVRPDIQAALIAGDPTLASCLALDHLRATEDAGASFVLPFCWQIALEPVPSQT